MARSQYLAFGKPHFSEAEIDAVARVMRSGWVGMGPETLAFEEELAAFFGVPHVVTVNSCTSALLLSLSALGVGRGDEVVCPSLTWCATANAALYLGATPVFCDVDPETLCLSPQCVRAKLSPRTRAIIAVHYGGYAADVGAIRRVVPPHIAIVEDAAHALGARLPDGRMVGASGNLTCFSFYANKNLSTGEGGAIALTDSTLAARLRSLRQNAMPQDAWKRFTHPEVVSTVGITQLGYKANYTDLQAAIGRVQLRRQGEFQARRLALAGIPVGKVGREQRICDVRLPGATWAADHWRRLAQAYRRAPHFNDYRQYFEDLYLHTAWQTLADLNQALVVGIARDLLGIDTPVADSLGYEVAGQKTDRLLSLLERCGADCYVSGPSARAYLDEPRFTERGIRVIWKDYRGYPEYGQLYPPFEHGVTILDLLFHVGANAPWYIWGWREAAGAVNGAAA
jgi:dTDP-4-amino-4,6-dideoxygalactose transaminase